jgi:ubiquinone/menaquinone biosynthesis C-methylase UbiE
VRAALRRAPRPLEERQARAHDEEVHPIWGARWEALQLGALPANLSGAVLHLGCAAGNLTEVLVERHQGKGRIVAIEESPALLDRARTRVRGRAEAPVFFRHHEQAERLPFAEESFDHVLAGPRVGDAPDLEALDAAIADLVRVTAPGGQVVLALPLAGTWDELLDLFAEVLRRTPGVGPAEAPAAPTLAEYRAHFPDGERLAEALRRAGLVDVQVETSRWQLLFRSGREFFYAPVIEQGPLPAWRAIAADQGDMLGIFISLKDAIDTYFAGQAFVVSVVAGCAVGRKPAAAVAEAPTADSSTTATTTTTTTTAPASPAGASE